MQLAGANLAPQWVQALTEVCVDTSLAQPAKAYLRFKDPFHLLLGTLKAKIGVQLTIGFLTSDGPAEQVFAGEVTALETSADTQDGTFTAVWAMDGGHRLSRGRRVLTYADTTVKKVVGAAASRAGLRCGEVEADEQAIPYLAQPNVTDWEMLQHLACERGLRVSVEGAAGNVLCLRRAAGKQASVPFALERGKNLLSLRAQLTSIGQVDAVNVRGWEVKAKKALAKSEKVQGKDRVKVGITSADTSTPFKTGEDSVLLVSGRPYATGHDVDTAARALADDCAAAFAELEAEAVGHARLKAGEMVTVTGVGEPFNGLYTVSSCQHRIDLSAPGTAVFRTRVLVGAVPAGPVPPPAPLSAHGVAIAVVTDTKEPHEGQHGMVRLNFPWMGPTYVTDWTRSVQYGGVGGGGVLPLEPGDEVLVGFEHGRLDRPFVLGGLYNGQDTPSEHDGVDLVDPKTGKANRRSLASRDGDRIEILTPAKGAQGIRLITGKDPDRSSLLLDRSAKAVTVFSGTDDNAVSLTLDHAKKHAVLASGTEKDQEKEQVKILLDQGGKILTLSAGTDDKTTVSLTLSHKEKEATLASGTDQDKEQVKILLSQKRNLLTLNAGTDSQTGISLTLDHKGQQAVLASGTDNDADQVKILLDRNKKCAQITSGKDKQEIKLDQKTNTLSISGGKDGSIAITGTNISLKATEKMEMTAQKNLNLSGDLGVAMKSENGVKIGGSTVDIN